MNVRRAKSTTISWAGSFCHYEILFDLATVQRNIAKRFQPLLSYVESKAYDIDLTRYGHHPLLTISPLICELHYEFSRDSIEINTYTPMLGFSIF